MEETKQKTNPLVWIVVVVVIIFGVYKLLSPKWTLMICEEVMDNGVECYSFASIQKDQFATKEMCLEIGTTVTKDTQYPVFECGRKCKHDGVFMVCDEICNMYGVCK
jgi:hypothetical protein